MQGSEELSIEELGSNLSTYKEQLQQVKALLVDDPGNSEYADMEKELEEVIVLTEELLVTAKQNEVSGVNVGHTPDGTSHYATASSDMSEPFERFSIGTKVQAVWSEDGEWYNATIEAHTPNGYYVTYDEWGNKEEVDPDNVRPIEEGTVDALVEAEKEAEATKQALKRKIAQAAVADYQSKTLPAKLRIEPDDPEDVAGDYISLTMTAYYTSPFLIVFQLLCDLRKIAKRKKIHAFKSKMRFEQLEVTQNKRQNAWQQFQTAKGRSKKIGFFSGRKRESIFKSPDDPKGKVGVTGSGKGLTDFQKREKHLHLKAGGAEGED